MTNPFERFVFCARLGLVCLGQGSAALSRVDAALAEQDPDWASESESVMGFAITAPGPATSLTLGLWGVQQGGPLHACLAVAGYLAPGTGLVIGVLTLLMSGGLVLPTWTSGFAEGLTVAAVILFGHMLVQRAPQMAGGSLPAALALLSAALVWLLPDATGQIMALAGCALIALALNLAPPEEVSFERHRLFESREPRWTALLLLSGVVLLPWLLADSGPGWVASLLRSSFLILQNETLLLAALEADLNLDGSAVAVGYGLVAGSGAPTAVLAAAAGFASAPSLLSAIALSLIALILIHASTVFSIVFLWPRWQVWRRKNGLASILAGVQAAAFGIMAVVFFSPLLTTAVSSFTSVVLLAAGIFALIRLQCPPWLLAAGLGLISAMASTF